MYNLIKAPITHSFPLNTALGYSSHKHQIAIKIFISQYDMTDQFIFLITSPYPINILNNFKINRITSTKLQMIKSLSSYKNQSNLSNQTFLRSMVAVDLTTLSMINFLAPPLSPRATTVFLLLLNSTCGGDDDGGGGKVEGDDEDKGGDDNNGEDSDDNR